jgi:hypothetical protein
VGAVEHESDCESESKLESDDFDDFGDQLNSVLKYYSVVDNVSVVEKSQLFVSVLMWLQLLSLLVVVKLLFVS